MNKITCAFISVLRHSNKSYSSAALLGRQLSYKSDLSLDKIYPGARLQLYTPPPPVSDLNRGILMMYTYYISSSISAQFQRQVQWLHTHG